MKRFCAVALALCAVMTFSCKKEETRGSGEVTLSVKPLALESTEERVFEPGNFFTPDYTPYEPEAEDRAGKVNLTWPKSKGEKILSIIPGLRKLSDYLTSYSDRQKEFKMPEIKALADRAENSSKSKRADQPFVVSDWGPQDAIPAEVHYPSFYVLFSEPVIPLAAAGSQQKGSDYFTLEPEVNGVYRWNGTSLLTFECKESVNPQQVYRIRVSDKVKSLSGKELTGDKIFSTKAAPLAIIWSAAGYSKSKWVDESEVPPECAQELRVQFNYPVKAEAVKAISTISFAKFSEDEHAVQVAFDVKQELIDTVTYTWKEKTPYDTFVILRLAQEGVDKDKSPKVDFHTLSPFTYQYDNEGWTYGKYTNPRKIEFSHPVDLKSAYSAVTAKSKDGKPLPLTKENLDVQGSTLTVYGLPVEFHSTYVISISDSLKDIYGRKLTVKDADSIQISVDVPGPESAARFVDSGVKMLEKQFPHRLVFEHQNIDEGAYLLQKTDKPYDAEDWSISPEKVVYAEENAGLRHNLPVTPRDERLFELVDFDSLLTDGTGWIDFKAAVKLPKKPTKWSKEPFYWTNNKMTVQVTDLGVTVRYGMNKVVALVTRLSDGKPVEGALVYASKDRKSPLDEIKKKAPSAVTDKNGMAVINLTGDDIQKVYSSEYWNVPAIIAEKDGDKVLFRPENHYPWRSGIYSYGSVPDKITAKPRIFMFSDRGLYKPGEKLSFRGIDRDQILGTFVPYEGSYQVTLQEEGWNNVKVFGKVEGKTSESGGYYGSITIPEDIVPGMYLLRYQRADGKKEDIYVNVAFFERLKFQTALSMPKTPVIAGEKVQASLSASYLAGGALASASYETNWFREPWYFTSEEPELNQYRFGPVHSEENRSQISDGSGLLDANGQAVLSCDTKGNSIKGLPYRYRLSAEVTDLSNQLVTANGASVVHPASYYIGLLKPVTSAAFARKGEKLTFAYKLATPDGKTVVSDKTARALTGSGKKAKVTLTREEWNLVQQQGISDIYSRYEKTELVESEESVSLSAEGKITVTPKEAGSHKIQIASTDSAGRDVITEYEFFVTGSGQVSWYQDDASELRLTPDKNQYNPGETAHLLLESTLPEGNYLITVEREGIFTEEVRHLDGSIHVLDIPVARNYVPVFYVSVSSYSVRQGKPSHTYGEVDLDKPKGYYGAATVFVNPRVKSFTVKVESSKPSYRPGEEAEITLTATKGGKALANAELTLLAVDRGVLDLIDYHVPDPLAFFYNTSNFPLQVKGGDSREYLMDPVTYEVKNLKGGDSGENDKMEERKDFNPTAVFEPMLKTDEKGQVTVRFKLPDTLTTYRITAFGVHGELLALHEDEIAVQNPINVQQVLPRALRERDTTEAGLLLTNLDGMAHEMTVSLSLGEYDGAAAENNGVSSPAGKAFVDGKNQHTIHLPSGASTTVYFDLAAEKAGLVSLVFTVTSDVLNERLVTPLEIEKPYIFETVTTSGQLDADEEEAGESLVIPSWAEDLQGGVSVTLDASRLGLLGGAVNYLFNYPYGCMEQQSAKVLPLVIFGDYIDTFGLDKKVNNVHKCVVSYFKDWKNSQHADGGFGYWPASSHSDIFVSLRISHLYALALSRGYSKKELAIDGDKLLSFITDKMNDSSIKPDDYLLAYASYVQALQEKTVAESQLMQLVEKERQGIAVLALAGLASQQNNGKSGEAALAAAKKIRSYIRPATRGLDISDPAAPHGAFARHGGEAENLALVLQLFTLLDKDDEMNSRLVWSLLQNQRAGYWKNTAVTARVLDALYTVIKVNNLEKTNITASALLGGEKVAEEHFKGAAAKPLTVNLPFTDDLLKKQPKDAEIPLRFTKKGKGALYYTASMRYALPQEAQPARDEGLGLDMRLYDNASGEEIPMAGDSPLVELESGKTYRMTLTLSSSYDRDFIALRAPVPSGAEILDATFVTSPDAAGDTASGNSSYSKDYDEEAGWYYGGSHYMSNQAIYNGEIQFFWDSFGKGKTTAEFKFRAVRRGVYPTPPVNAECMYEPEVFGRTAGRLYTIK